MLRPEVATENDVGHFSKVGSTGGQPNHPNRFTPPWYEVVVGLPIPGMIPKQLIFSMPRGWAKTGAGDVVEDQN